MDKINNTFFVFIIIIICFISCTNKTSNIRLTVDTDNSIIAEPLFIYDSITIKNSPDSIIFIKYSNGRPYITRLFERKSEFYEIRKTFDFGLTEDSLPSFRIDTLITLSTKDTSYNFKYGLITLTVFGLQFSSMYYDFTREGNMYKTFKRSMQDSTYTEILYYDKNYQINKFINTWRNNKIEYTKAEKRY